MFLLCLVLKWSLHLQMMNDGPSLLGGFSAFSLKNHILAFFVKQIEPSSAYFFIHEQGYNMIYEAFNTYLIKPKRSNFDSKHDDLVASLRLQHYPHVVLVVQSLF